MIDFWGKNGEESDDSYREELIQAILVLDSTVDYDRLDQESIEGLRLWYNQVRKGD